MQPDQNTTNVPESTQNVQSSDKNNKTLLSVLSYVGPLVIVSFIMGKDIPSVKFHVKQGAVLFIIEVIVWLLTSFFLWRLWFIVNLINLAMAVLSIIGIINAIKNQEKELPVVGGLAKNLKF